MSMKFLFHRNNLKCNAFSKNAADHAGRHNGKEFPYQCFEIHDFFKVPRWQYSNSTMCLQLGKSIQKPHEKTITSDTTTCLT